MVTGAAGFLGRYLIEEMLGQDYFESICALVRSHPVPMFPPKVYECQGSIIDNTLESAMSAFKPDVVVHLAALTGIASCEKDPTAAFHVNVLGTFNVLRSCLRNGAGIIFASSREVHGETEGSSTSETSPRRPGNVYGTTKLLGEAMIEAMDPPAISSTVLRITNVYGPKGDNYGVQKLIQQAVRNLPITILGGDQVMNLVHVRDTSKAIVDSIKRLRGGRETYLLGSHENVTVRDLVERIIELSGSTSKLLEEPMRVGETRRFVPNLDRIESELGWRAQIDLNDGLTETIKWYKLLQAK